MHVEIDRVPDDEDAGEIEESLLRVLRDVRESVEDWEKMHSQVLAIVDELDDRPAAAVRRGGRAGQRPARAGWPTTTSPSSATASTASRPTATTRCSGRCPAPASASSAPTRTCRRRSASCPPLVKAKAREKTLLVLAKANSRATVHRPAYLDYVGVKKFDENGEVVGERRFLGLFSSAAYTESLTRIPLLREKAAEVLRRIGFDPRSHAGKALMDTLETYPRDELFHTPVDELAPIAEAVMHARERRQLRLFIRRDTYGRYVSVLVYLPRDRYNTNVRERFSAILKDRLGGDSRRVHRPGDRVDDRPCTSWSTRPRARRSPRSTPPTSSAGSPRRPAPGATTSRPRCMTEYGEEAGARLARRYVDSFPEAYKEDFLPATGAVDLGRLEALDVGTDDEGIDLSLYEEMDAGRGEARLKVFRIGPALSLSEVLPMLSSMGVEVVDERPYQLEGLGPADVHLRVRAALRPDRARRGARAVPGRAARGLGRLQRDRRLQRAGARRPA